MNFGTLKEITRNLLSDNINFTPSNPSAVTAQSYTETQLAEAINWAAKKYVDKKAIAPNAIGTATRSTTTAKFTMPGTFNGVIRVMYVFTSDGISSPRLLESTLEYERLRNVNFNVTTPGNGAAKRWLYSNTGISEIILAPKVPTGTTTVEVHVVDSPNTLALDADTIGTQFVPAAAQEYLKYAAAAWLLQNTNDMQNIQLADKWMDTFNNLIAGTGV